MRIEVRIHGTDTDPVPEQDQKIELSDKIIVLIKTGGNADVVNILGNSKFRIRCVPQAILSVTIQLLEQITRSCSNCL